ncbi:MAG: histone-lysine N-methyltransferase [Planctomycetota bacterium]|nr:histone-lysine N-methyltransferase [Planctomycetota bacterium]
MRKLLMVGPRKRELENPSEPDLMREMFPYTEVPRLIFDGIGVPMNLPDEFWVTDTTFRDGQQARPPYAPEQILKLYDLLHRLGGPRGVVRACEFFLYAERDRKAVEMCLGRGYKYPEVTGWIRADKKDFDQVKAMGLKETGILCSASDYHIYLKLGKDRAKAMHDYLAIVEAALEKGIIPRCHLEDITRADFYGFCVPFAQRLMDLSRQARLPVKIRLCDTMGYGVSYSTAALPRGVPKLVYGMIHEAGVPSECLEWHGHNDFHKVLTNAVTAWLYGCASVNCALVGFGERTGNTPLEAMIIEYIGLRGETNETDTTVITEIAEYLEKEVGFRIPHNYPFVGAAFNQTSAGIHVDGIIKNEEIYNIFDTKKILNRGMSVSITDKSGVAGVAYWINTNIPMCVKAPVSKRHPGVVRIFEHIQKEFDEGRVTSLSHAEMMRLVRKYLPQLFVSDLDKIKEHARRLATDIIEKAVEHPAIRSMNPRRQERFLQKIVSENPFIQFAYVVNTEGKSVTRHVTHPSDRALYKVLEGVDFSDREWFKRPMADGNIFCSDLYTSRITNKLIFTVSGVIEDESDKIAGVLELDIKFEEVAKLEPPLPEE